MDIIWNTKSDAHLEVEKQLKAKEASAKAK